MSPNSAREVTHILLGPNVGDGMKVFLGWSGERSQAVGAVLREWLPLILHYVEPWLSETDVAAGTRWAHVIAKELESSNFGIICVTPENLHSPWIPFEAGSLAKSLGEGRVIPLLLDLHVSQISGPLAQFQAKKVDESGVRDVVQSINSASAEPIPAERISQLFEALWPQFETRVDAIPVPSRSVKPERSQVQILEELVMGVRSLQSRRRETKDGAVASRDRLSRPFDPEFAEMALFHTARALGGKPGDPTWLMVGSSALRDQYPWLFELALEAYRLARSGDLEAATHAREQFFHAAEVAYHVPPMFGEDSESARWLLRFLTRQNLRGPAKDEAPPWDSESGSRPREKKSRPTSG